MTCAPTSWAGTGVRVKFSHEVEVVGGDRVAADCVYPPQCLATALDEPVVDVLSDIGRDSRVDRTDLG